MPSQTSMHADVIVIGAGLSGLACALTLKDNGLQPLVLEAGDRPGGRIRTDSHDGFLLDRGFQVLQTWYPEARRFLDYRRLDLRPFYPGALLRLDAGTCRVSDIWRRPTRALEMLLSPIGTTADKVRLWRLRRHCLAGDLEALYQEPDRPALELLSALGFSSRMVEGFFKPFFSGVFFEPELACSARAFAFVFRAFALGDTALPAHGMGEITAQLAARLAPGGIRLGCRAMLLSDRQVLLESGERLGARALVIATEGRETARLLGRPETRPIQMTHRGTTCLYFAAERGPFTGPYLMLNGESPEGRAQGPVNSLLCPSNLSQHYAPPGRSLITVNCHGAEHDPEVLDTAVRLQLSRWFGDQVGAWTRLAAYRLPDALPAQLPPVPFPGTTQLRQSEWLWVCGEYHGAPSIHWALHSGRRAGTDIVRALLSGEGQRGRKASASTSWSSH
jgi:phytoene dehydrogenase-like protein